MHTHGHESLDATLQVKVNKQNEGIATFLIKNNYSADVDVTIELSGDTEDYFCLEFPEDEEGVCKVKESNPIEVVVNADFPPGFNEESAYEAVKLIITTNDGISTDKRGEELYVKRVRELELYIDYVSSGELQPSKGLLAFNADHTEETFILSITGEEPITVTEVIPLDPDVFKRFTIPDLKTDAVITKENPLSVKVQCDANEVYDDISTRLTIHYMVMGLNGYTEIALLVAGEGKTLFNSNRNLPDNIVAIDFGTGKTAVAFTNINKVYNSEGNLDPKIEMVKFYKKGDSVGSIVEVNDMPSVIAHVGGRYYIGYEAVAQAGGYFASSIKMQLQNPKIEFIDTLGGESLYMDTPTVLKEYMRQLKRLLPDSIRDANNMYVLTLPVLDKSGEGALYKQQETITKASMLSAKLIHSLSDEENVETITEPEAAMFHILRTVEQGELGIGFQNGQTICIFDFGAGTLDYFVGEYNVVNNKPEIKEVFSAGAFGKDKYTIGGNTIDNLLLGGLLVDEDNPTIRYDGAVYRDLPGSTEQRVVDFKRFDEGSSAYPGINKARFLTDFIKRAKETFVSPDIDESGIEVNGEDYYSDNMAEYHYSGKGTHKFTILEHDLNDHVDTMLSDVLVDIKNEPNGDIVPDFVFMVGGSSLLKQAKDSLTNYLGVSDICSPRDYLKMNDYDSYEERRALYSATGHSVVKGAILSQIYRVSRHFAYALKIVFKGNNDIQLFTFEKGDDFPVGKKSYKNRSNTDLRREWTIYGKHNDEWYDLGSFVAIEATQKPGSCTFYVDVCPDRKLKLSYACNGEKNDININDIYV